MREARMRAAICITFLSLAATTSWGPAQETVKDLGNDVDGQPNRSLASPPQLIRDGDVELRVEASAQSARIADPIELRLIFEAPLGTQATMPATGANLGDFEVLGNQVVAGLPIDGEPRRRRWDCTLTLESLDSGEHLVPSLEVIYRLSGDPSSPLSQTSIRSLAFPVQIGSLIENDHDPREFRDIKNAVMTPALQPKRNQFFWWVIGGVLLVAMVAAGLLWSRRNRASVPVEWACQEIDLVEVGIERGQISPTDAYANLSIILRAFLEQQFHFPATSQSNAELRAELIARSIPSSSIAPLTQFLADSDEVKFSGRAQPRQSLSESPAPIVRELVRGIAASTTEHSTTDHSRRA